LPGAQFTAILSAVIALSAPALFRGQQPSHAAPARNTRLAAKLDFKAAGASLRADPVEAQIVAALKLVSEELIKANISRPVDFCTPSDCFFD
jgi:hypothetical protein